MEVDTIFTAVILYSLLASLRLYHRDLAAITDAVLLIGFSNCIGTPFTKTIRDYGNFVVIGGFFLTSCYLFWRTGLWRNHLDEGFPAPKQNDFPCSRPFFFPCETVHTRHLPKKHSFRYSYLFVGIPIGLRGQVGQVLSIDSRNRLNWFTVNAEDYLQRGAAAGGLQGKLHAYLCSQGCDPHDYPHVYLLTAPAFLGYSFNPVSFWYLYSKKGVLEAMILEVNNTFDERHMYLIKASKETDDNDSQEDAFGNLISEVSKKKFLGSCEKRFYVSPFNSRDGFYSFRALDPFSCKDGRAPFICNNIVLNSEGKMRKLTATISSTASAIDPWKLSAWSAFKFVFSWWWIELITFPRIVKEAAILFFKKKLQIWRKPKVVAESIPRKSTFDERLIGGYFRDFLKYHIRTTPLRITMRYTAAGASAETETILSCNNAVTEEGEHLEIEALTPDFYRNLIYYSSAPEAIRVESRGYTSGHATLRVSEPNLLPEIFPTVSKYREKFTRPTGSPTEWLESLRWFAFYSFRRLACQWGPSNKDVLPIEGQLPTNTTLSEFVRHLLHSSDSRDYRHACYKIFLADIIAFSDSSLLRVYDFVLRCGFAWGALCLTSLIERAHSGTTHVATPGLSKPTTLLLLNSVHLWALLKQQL